MQTIGDRLEEARKKKGISIREAAEATKIRGDYLQKFESNHFDIGLTEIYTRGFLRNYANFLKLPAERILNDYSSLGRGDVRPRQPSREVYGRMDISVASANEPSDRAAPPEEGAAAEASPARAQPHYPRSGGSSLPTGPDPAVVFKYTKYAVIAVVVLLALWAIKAVFSGSSGSSARAPATTSNVSPAPAESAPASPAANSYKLVALDTVFVRVTNLIGVDTDGEEIFKGTLNKGQVQVIPWTGPQNVWASAGEKVKLQQSGSDKLWPMTFTGFGHGQMPAPPASR